MKGLSINAMEAIENLIGSQFDSLGVEFLGLIPKLSKEKKIVFTTNKDSLVGMFLKALGTKDPNKTETQTMKLLLKVANGYIDALKSRTTSRVLNGIDSYIKDQNNKGLAVSSEEIKKIMADEMKDAKKGFELIANSAAEQNWNTATALQIAKIADERGDEDPTICFIVVRDEKTGFYEWLLHLLPDGKTPRVWKLSEVISDYYSPGGQYPSLAGLHRSCRCRISYLVKKWGFNADGKVTYIGKDHDEFKSQRETYDLPDVPSKRTKKNGKWVIPKK